MSNEQIPLCKCGCGRPVKKNSRGKFNLFINGHNSKGKNNPFYGKRHTKETKQKIRQARLGTHLSLETRQKISIAEQGHPCSEETRKKLSIAKSGEKHHNWKGGICRSAGRVFVLTRRGGKRRYIARSRLVMEHYLKRKLASEEIVHHINGISDDDQISNLVITTRAAHVRLHHTGAKRTKETKMRIGQASRGRKHTEETKRRISESLKNGRYKYRHENN